MTAGLMVGFKLNSPKIIVAKDVSDLNPHLYIIISPDNIITFKVPNIELVRGLIPVKQ